MMDKNRFLTTSEMWHIYQAAVRAYQGKVEPFTFSTADKTAPKGIRTRRTDLPGSSLSGRTR